jgi:sugar/nucleoside kinase (ribokinase family)
MAKVVSLGVHIVDVLGRPVAGIPRGQNLAILDEIRITVAGTAAGASVDMAKLGLEVIAMGAIGNDEIGEFLLGVMRRYGIDTAHLKRKAETQTSSTMLPIRPNGERPALHVIGANGELSYEDLDLDVIAQAQFLHLGGTPLLLKAVLKGLDDSIDQAQTYRTVLAKSAHFPLLVVQLVPVLLDLGFKFVDVHSCEAFTSEPFRPGKAVPPH